MNLSFIIPALNEENYIGKCLSSINPQISSEDEVIVIDNGSTDKTILIAKAFGAKVIKEKKKGISHARNRGATEARGEILCFIDADGSLSSTWVEEVKRGFSKKNIQAMVGLNIFTHEKVSKFLFYNGYTIFGYSGMLLYKFVLGNLYLSGNNFAIKKTLFEKLGGFDPVVGEDYWLSKRFWKMKNKRAMFSTKMIVWYSSRGFDAAGYYKTLSLWMKSALIKIPQDNYSYKNKNIN